MSGKAVTPARIVVETSLDGLVVSEGGEVVSEVAVDLMVATVVVVSLYDEEVL